MMMMKMTMMMMKMLLKRMLFSGNKYCFINCVPGGLLFLSPVMYPKYKCSISEDEDEDDDDDDPGQK